MGQNVDFTVGRFLLIKSLWVLGPFGNTGFGTYQVHSKDSMSRCGTKSQIYHPQLFVQFGQMIS